MLSSSGMPVRKAKICLKDYPFQRDIKVRLVMANLNVNEIDVLREIIHHSLKISIEQLADDLATEVDLLLPILDKLSATRLFTRQNKTLVVDKEMRKYFEFQLQRFDENFKPDLEFLQGLLRKVPIHVLPIWYAIPRTSNNIFESIVEKNLLTPQVFHRYLSELNFTDPIIQGIVKDVLATEKISTSDLISKYNLTRRNFEEIIVLLEFSFICSIRYVKEDDHWHEIVTPFHEWSQYLRFLKETESPIIDSSEYIARKRESDYAFVEDMTLILQTLQKKPLLPNDILSLASVCQISVETPEDLAFAKQYLSHLTEKMCLIKLAALSDGRLYAFDSANDWLDLSIENKALFLYRHPFNRILSLPIPAEEERNIREAEKSIKRVLHGQWVYFDEFIKGVYVPLNEDSVVMLKKSGKHWKYTLPTYSDATKTLIKATVFEWLFECGVVATGFHEGRDCFCVTPFGRFFFAD